MSLDRFNVCLPFVLREEGGYSNDPRDPGGATNLGITIATLTRWRGRSCTPADVRALTRDEAAEIYHAQYWNALRCGDLRPGLDLLAFDAAVNPGQGWAARELQRQVGAEVDGLVGPMTVLAARGADTRAIINGMSVARAAYYRSRPGFRTYGNGWLGRTDRCRDAALAALTLVAA
ncbi:conserved protein of unknown function (plasmid) [Rhodovastum atsumiense]|uniref:glycoside hydrolase family 108 protein n=1 Tax=Rhodovastum atsumiense TaxID=504468 RepID=UPI00139F2CA6|nr:glycoside hydrolase family 108 protein [Rhodovastum atsumiense]CAH2606501.1 conserved protein of unknown function [Rhodovastum atsumiense]